MQEVTYSPTTTIITQPAPGAQPAPETAAAPTTFAKNDFAHWAHQHSQFTKRPISYFGYQMVRAAIAAIPYGLAMAAVHHGFGLMGAKGQQVGLSVGETLEQAVFKNNSTKAVIGRNVARLASSPLNAAAQIGLGFSFFRTTGGLVKTARDKVFNSKNTEEQTRQEVKNLPHTLWDTLKHQLPAELGSVPIAALVLGFMNANFAYPKGFEPKRDAVKFPGIKGFGKQVAEMWSPQAKLLQHAATWTVSYSLFFLLAESLAKDIQLRKGEWKGHPNSLKNAPDDTVGGPPIIKTTKDGNFRFDGQHANDEEKPKTQPKPAFPFLTAEPSIGRFVFRRVLPVAVGISAYAAMKRVGYLKFGGLMEKITPDMLNKGVGEHTKLFVKNAVREGAATSMFFTLWAATDAWGSWYDKFFQKFQKQNAAQVASTSNDNAHVGASSEHQAITPHQVAKYDELLARVNAKEQGAGRAA